jgi:hypothetical protein
MLYNSTTRLNDGILRVHRFSVVTPARLHRSDFIFRFYVYGGIFNNIQGYLLSARRTVYGALCADVSLDMLGLLVCFLLEIRIRLWVAVHTLRKRYILVASSSLFSFNYLLLFDLTIS